jgi:hypothetical protein
MRQVSRRRRTGRRLAVLVVAAIVAATFASSAIAKPPTKSTGTFTLDGDLTDVCPFAVAIHSTITLTEIDYFDQNDNLTRVYLHTVEQDVFTGITPNGKSLTGVPFEFNLQLLFNEQGEITHAYASGVVERIPLPDGTLFVSAGRLDFIAHPGAVFVLSPDVGNSGNIDAFCAALADP